ncbi:MAG: GNAT family N-acetyltransferase [Clostridia bacterium]|nr:GNAT family N-acetyltransferase [Clostridia bacterium]
MKKQTIYHIFSHIPQLETERLILRRMLVSDAEDMFDYAHRSDVTRHLTWDPHPDIQYTREYLAYISAHYAAGDFFDWAVIERASGRMIGTCGFTRFHCEADCAEIGYVLHPSFWGRGIATEAVREVIRFGFQRLEVNRIEAKFMEGNEASRRVMEKNGMTFEGMLRQSMYIKGDYRNVGICSILRSEYFSWERGGY